MLDRASACYLAAALLAVAVVAGAAGPAAGQDGSQSQGQGRGQGQGQGRGNNQIQIGDLGLIDLGRWDGHNPLMDVEPHCVTGQPPDGSFALRAVGDGRGGAFTLYDGAATLSYSVQYDDGVQRVDLQPGAVVGPLDGIKKKKDFEACTSGGAGENRLLVRVAAAELRNALAGDYSGTLRLMIEAR